MKVPLIIVLIYRSWPGRHYSSSVDIWDRCPPYFLKVGRVRMRSRKQEIRKLSRMRSRNKGLGV